MAQVMIKCPATGKDVFTGMGMSKGDFESCELEDNQAQCPHCGQMHAWDKSDAWVQEKQLQ